MIEWYYREVEQILKDNPHTRGAFVVDKEHLKYDHATLTKGLEAFVKAVDTLARAYKLRVAISTREGNDSQYFVRWESYRWRLS